MEDKEEVSVHLQVGDFLPQLHLLSLSCWHKQTKDNSNMTLVSSMDHHNNNITKIVLVRNMDHHNKTTTINYLPHKPKLCKSNMILQKTESKKVNYIKFLY